MTKRKTREEKVKSGYRLQNFRLQAVERAREKDINEFGYLSSEYVVGDLRRTLLYTLIILGLIVVAKQYLG